MLVAIIRMDQITHTHTCTHTPHPHSQCTQVSNDDLLVSVRWSPPEVLDQGPGAWTEKGDVWSFGVVAWEVFSYGAEPYADMSNIEVCHAVMHTDRRLPRPRR